ncbi:MAG: dTDP-glucose 4,6-dehydratase [Candidatus Melainabacteria bacterium]
MTTRLLVTGGAGFIGSSLLRALLAAPQNYQVTNLDLLTYAGNPQNLTEIENHPRYRFVQGDIADAALVDRLMAEADACVNVAAQTHVDRSIDGPGVFFTTNVLGAQVLLEAARKHGIQKFVQISTDEVYGSLGFEDPAFSEQSPVQPSSPYSASKAAADLVAISYYRTYGLPVCLTRCSNNYGPRQYPEKLIPLFILNAIEDKPVPVYGDGLNVRDWIHVDDHSAAVLRVLQDGRPGEVYNVGSDNEWNNLQITRMLLQILDKPDTLITYVTDRPGHDRRYAIDSTKLQRELGWQPTHTRCDFQDMLAETVRWYQENPDWVAQVRQRLAAHEQEPQWLKV